MLAKDSKAVGKRIVDIAVPATVNILAIKRGDVFIAPNGSTKLQANDILCLLAENKMALQLPGQSSDIQYDRNRIKNISSFLSKKIKAYYIIIHRCKTLLPHPKRCFLLSALYIFLKLLLFLIRLFHKDGLLSHSLLLCLTPGALIPVVSQMK